MKPGDHPDFYRFAPPPGTSRESTIVLDREGRFWHDGERVDRPALEQALRRWIARHPDDGRLILTNGYDWCYFRADDAPYFITSLEVEGDGRVSIGLFDGAREPLDPRSLWVDEEGVVRAKVKGGLFEARFTRHAQAELGAVLVEAEPPTVRVGGEDIVLPVRGVEPSGA
jgi:hypothetical protein